MSICLNEADVGLRKARCSRLYNLHCKRYLDDKEFYDFGDRGIEVQLTLILK